MSQRMAISGHSDNASGPRLARRAVQGAIVMMARQAVSIVATLVGGVLLARFLSPAEFGAFALLTLLNNLAGIITDLGLATTLIRQASPPTPREFSSVFTVEQVLSLLFAGAELAALPLLARWGHDVPNLGWAVVCLAAATVASPVSTIGLALLEARLDFRAVGIILASQTFIFYGVAVALAAKGYGILSVGAGLAIGSIWSAILASILTGWRPSILRDASGIRARLSFGIPYIGSAFVSVLKDAITPLFIGVAFGAVAAGYINWAQTLAVASMLMLFPLTRVFFPVFVRLRDKQPSMDVAIVRSTFWSYVIAAPLTLFTIGNVHLVTGVLYGDRWFPAIGIVIWLTAANILSPAVNVLFVVLNVQGRPQTTLKYTMAYMAATWVLVPVAATFGSYSSYGWANLLVTLINLPLIYRMRSHFAGHVMDMGRPWLAALVAVVFGRWIAYEFVSGDAGRLASSAGLAVITYLVVLGLLGRHFIGELRAIAASKGVLA